MIACDDKENVLAAEPKSVVSGLMLLAPVRRVVLHIYSSRIDRLPWTEMNYDTSAMNFDQVYFKDWNPPGSFFKKKKPGFNATTLEELSVKIHFDCPTIRHLPDISDTWTIVNALIVQAVGSLRSIHVNALPCNSVAVPLPGDMAAAIANCVNLRVLFLGTVNFPTHLVMGAMNMRPIMQKLVLPLRQGFINDCFAAGRTPSTEHLVIDIDRIINVPEDPTPDDRTAQRWFWNGISIDPAIRL